MFPLRTSPRLSVPPQDPLLSLLLTAAGQGRGAMAISIVFSGHHMQRKRDDIGNGTCP